jgi:hypothetical protein
MVLYTYLYLLYYLLLLYILKISADKSYGLRFRNSLLRLYIASDKKKFINEYSDKIIYKTKTKLNILYNKILSKYHDTNMTYFTLTDEEKELLEFVISLIY